MDDSVTLLSRSLGAFHKRSPESLRDTVSLWSLGSIPEQPYIINPT